jgi:hypothetical protein
VVLPAFVEAMQALVADPARNESVANRAGFLHRVDRELPNLRWAMHHLIDEAAWDRQPPEVVDAWLKFGSDLCIFLGSMGAHYRVAYEWGIALLARSGAGSDQARADLMLNASDVARCLGLREQAQRLIEEAATLVVAPAPDDLERFAPTSCHARLGLGVLALDSGDLAQARAHLEHVLEHPGDSYPHTWSLIDLGLVLSMSGDLEGAVSFSELGGAMAERLADAVAVVGARLNVPSYLRMAGRAEESVTAFRDNVGDLLALPNVEMLTVCAEDVACSLADLDRHEEAGLLFHAAHLVRSAYAPERVALQELFVVDALERTRAALGPRWEECRRRAESMSLPQALQSVLGV